VSNKKKVYCNKCGAFIGYIIEGQGAADNEIIIVCPKCNKIIGPSETKEGGDGT